MNDVKKVMLLIDADNLSPDVMAQAVEHVREVHGAVHVRRAYCTAEAALQHRALFKAHSIRPIVNISAGKNSTDIAMAVDAIDLAIAERPDVVVIASSDSDFAPLVLRLREKGCRVCGIGQQGKTGDEVVQVYDQYTVLVHRRSSRSAAEGDEAAAPPPRARSRARSGATARSRAPAAEAPPRARSEAPAPVPTPAPPAAVVPSPAKAPAKTGGRRARAEPPARDTAAAAEPTSSERAAPVRETVREPAAAPARPAGKSLARSLAKTLAKAAPVAAPVDTAPPDEAFDSPAPAKARRGGRTARAAEAAPLPDEVRRILDAVPELRQGAKLPLNIATEKLRAANLLARSAPSTRLFRKHPDLFDLLPHDQPNQVVFRGAADR